MWYCIYIYNGPKPPQLETCKILKQVSVSAGVVYHFFFNHINYIHIPLMLHQCKNHAILTAFIFSTTSIVLAFQTEQTFLWNVWLLLFIYNKCPCFDMLWYLMQRHAVPFQRNLRCVRVVMLWEHLCMFVSWSMCEISRRLQLRGPDARGVMPLRAAPSGGLTPHHTVPASPQCPQGIVLPTLPSLVHQGTVVSSDFGSQCLPKDVAPLTCSLRGGL